MGVNITDREMYDRFEKLEKTNSDEHYKIMRLLSAQKAGNQRLWVAVSGIGVLSLSTLGWLISSIMR